MSIRQLVSFALHCDACELRFEGGDYSIWLDPNWALELADESDWWIGSYHEDEYEGAHSDKHYCTACAVWTVEDDDSITVTMVEKK